MIVYVYIYYVMLPINFGLPVDLNWKLMLYLDYDTLSRLNLHSYYIDKLYDKLNLDILKNKKLSYCIQKKYNLL
jgi:hypothetical protein